MALARGGPHLRAGQTAISAGYRRELPLAPLLVRHGEVAFPAFAKRLRCSASGSAKVEVRPAWRNPMQRDG